MGLLPHFLIKFFRNLKKPTTPVSLPSLAPSPETSSFSLAQNVEIKASDAKLQDQDTHDDEEKLFNPHISNSNDDFGPFSNLTQNPSQNNMEEFWYQIFTIEDAGHKSDQALLRAFANTGIRDIHHFHQIQDTFRRHFGQLSYFEASMLKARDRQGKEILQAAEAREAQLFEPIQQISIEMYATIQARLANFALQDSTNINIFLAEFQLNSDTWKQIDAAWLKRIHHEHEDLISSIALLARYGEAFAKANHQNSDTEVPTSDLASSKPTLI